MPTAQMWVLATSSDNSITEQRTKGPVLESGPLCSVGQKLQYNHTHAFLRAREILLLSVFVLSLKGKIC